MEFPDEYSRLRMYEYNRDKSPVNMTIQDRCKAWEPGDVILISAPTGSGKSTFIRTTLCNPVFNRACVDRPVLYFVNRAALKSQLINDIESDARKGNPYGCNIDVWTYQQLEYRLVNGGKKAEDALTEEFQKYVYIVLDECHYFLLDSNYNTETCVSFDFINRIFSNRIRIYMSATCNYTRQLLFNQYGSLKRENNESSYILDRYRLDGISGYYYEYTVPARYDHISLNCFDKSEDILSIIEENYDGSKWLIFINSKTKGNDLKNKIRGSEVLKHKGLHSEDVVFITAKSKDSSLVSPAFYNDKGAVFDSKTSEEKDLVQTTIKQIEAGKETERKVTICTSVFDNGISIHDTGLQNLVILADLYEEFIQMLGRKRVDEESNRIKLYICKQNINFFQSRCEKVSEALNAYEKYRGIIRRMGSSEERLSERQSLLNDILKKEDVREQLSSFTYVRWGKYLINRLSVMQLRYKKDFYDWIVCEMKKDAEAYIKCQKLWLGLPASYADQFYNVATENGRECAKMAIVEIIEGFIREGAFSSEQNQRLKKKLRAPVEQLLRYDNEDNWRNDILDLKKGTQNLSSKRFNRIMAAECINLPYKMIGPYNTGAYKISLIPKQSDERVEI